MDLPFTPRAYMLSFLVAFLVAMAGTATAKRIATRLEFYDHPAERKFHRSPVPYMGGVAIATALVVAIASPGLYFRPLAGVLTLALAICAVGLADDYALLHPSIKLVAQVLVGVGAYALNTRVALTHFWPVDLALTVFWIVGIINAINLLDNMDGLAAGISAIGAFFFMLLAALNGQYLVASLAAAISGACFAFLFFNLPPAEIFMGDAGSMTLGFLLAVIGIRLHFTNVNTITFGVPILVLGVAIFDTALVICTRLGHKISVFRGGKDHSSHRLVWLGMHPRDAVLTLYVVGISLGCLAIVLADSTALQAWGILGAVAALAVAAGIILGHVSVYEERQADEPVSG